jgi:glycosyltransferase involved in cell wall biosynthesis
LREALADIGHREDVKLVVAGKLPERDTSLTPDPRRLLEETALTSDAVRFIGFVPEAAKPALYRGARAFLFPSRYEGFGLPPLEALACGVPVVGSHKSSLPEVVGDAGILLAPDDVAGMADALAHLIMDDGFYGALRARARSQVDRFSWRATAQATWDAYRTVLG